MSDLQWYIYHQSKQMGPFGPQQVASLFTNNIITHEAFVFKVGWKDWLPIEESFQELGIVVPPPMKPKESNENKRTSAPRATVKGRIIVHNNGQLVIAKGVNISASGIFVETQSKIFKLGERLKLTCRIDDFTKQFNAVAEVIRRNSDARYAVGYGLRFDVLDQGVQEDIHVIVDRQNKFRVG